MLQWGLSVNDNNFSNAAGEVSGLYSVWHEFLHPGKQKIAPDTADTLHRGADKSLARPTSRCILFDG